MKKSLVFISIISIISFAIYLGIYIFKDTNKQNMNFYEAKQIEDECTIEGEVIKLGKYVKTTSSEEKVSPNAIFKLKKYYPDCNHTTVEKVELPKELINLNKDEVEDKYKEWELDEFSSEEIVLYREYSGICNQHYLVKIVNDVLGIYSIDKDGNKTLKEKTEIYAQYLPENDLSRLKAGIEVIGIENLNSLLEDYE